MPCPWTQPAGFCLVPCTKASPGAYLSVNFLWCLTVYFLIKALLELEGEGLWLPRQMLLVVVIPPPGRERGAGWGWPLGHSPLWWRFLIYCNENTQCDICNKTIFLKKRKKSSKEIPPGSTASNTADLARH